MKILVISDTHGRLDTFRSLIETVKPIDLLIHCGDVEYDEDEIRELAKCPCVVVRGNNDFFSNLENEEEIEIPGHRILITHGHYYYVNMSTTVLQEEAAARGCDIALFGHTHRPHVEYGKSVTVCNPGSLSYPRQDGKMPSYLIMDVTPDEVQYTIHYTEKC